MDVLLWVPCKLAIVKYKISHGRPQQLNSITADRTRRYSPRRNWNRGLSIGRIRMEGTRGLDFGFNVIGYLSECLSPVVIHICEYIRLVLCKAR
jgi:hypothetical protein